MGNVIHKPRCPCSKACYSKKEAETLVNIGKGMKKDKVPIRSYHCTRSNTWHVTSHEDTSYEDRQEKPLVLKKVWKKLLKRK